MHASASRDTLRILIFSYGFYGLYGWLRGVMDYQRILLIIRMAARCNGLSTDDTDLTELLRNPFYRAAIIASAVTKSVISGLIR
jgi:hypothetical protein